MQPSLQTFPRTSSQKVSNILIKYNSPYQHPEARFMMKYAPKYYHSLTLEVTPKSSLLSKVKKIKKLKTFEGEFVWETTPLSLGVNLLGNTRKEIEEFPLITGTEDSAELSESFKDKLNLQKIKFFSNVKRVELRPEGFGCQDQKINNLLHKKEDLVKYIRNMRSLKSLRINVDSSNYDQAVWFFERLNRMDKVLDRLEILTLDIPSADDVKELLLKNENVLSHLTGLRFDKFDPSLIVIPRACKNLKSLSFQFRTDVDKYPEVLFFLASIRLLENLTSFELDLIGYARGFLVFLKPQSSLRSLTLKFAVSEVVSGEFDGDIVSTMWTSHWEDIENLDYLEFEIYCENSQEILLAKSFVTKVLKKVRKLRAFKCDYPRKIADGSVIYAPFEIEEVAHLYESLEEFEFIINNDEYQCDEYTDQPVVLNLEKLKSFRNLKEVSLGDNLVHYENIEGIVDLLQERSDSTLQVKMESKDSLKRLKETLKKLARRERMGRNLQVKIHLRFETEDPVGLLDQLCEIIGSVRKIKGLEIYLNIFDSDWADPPRYSTENLREIIEKYSNIRNWVIIRIDGEKEQFFYMIGPQF